MTTILVDTNIIIDYLRRKDKENSLFSKIFSQKKHRAAISLTTIAELWAGKSMTKKKVFQKVRAVVNKCQIIALDLETTQLTGEILRKTNYQVSFQGVQVAALALRNKLPLLTLSRLENLSKSGFIPHCSPGARPPLQESNTFSS